jgi:hypothetical protein
MRLIWFLRLSTIRHPRRLLSYVTHAIVLVYSFRLRLVAWHCDTLNTRHAIQQRPVGEDYLTLHRRPPNQYARTARKRLHVVQPLEGLRYLDATTEQGRR